MRFDPNDYATAADIPDNDEHPRPNGHDHAWKGRFRLIGFDALIPGSDATYLVKQLIPRAALTVAWGPPKCGKSFWVFDLMMHVALGWEYRGHRVKQGRVVYLALEGANGYKLRAEAFRRQHSLPEGAAFSLIADAVDLVADHAALIAAILAQSGEVLPSAVVIDTLNRSLHGSESSDEDMAAYIRAADAIKDAFQCAVVVIHHCGHDDKRPRGHSALLGAVDCLIAVKRDDADNIVCTVERMKDGPEGLTIASRLEQVELGTDEDGDAITSCVVIEGELTDAKAEPTRGLTKGARLALRALDEALVEMGKPAPASNHIPRNVNVVSLESWRDYAYRRGVSASDQPRARQLAFQRAVETLLSSGTVASWDELYWKVQ